MGVQRDVSLLGGAQSARLTLLPILKNILCICRQICNDDVRNVCARTKIASMRAFETSKQTGGNKLSLFIKLKISCCRCGNKKMKIAKKIKHECAFLN